MSEPNELQARMMRDLLTVMRVTSGAMWGLFTWAAVWIFHHWQDRSWLELVCAFFVGIVAITTRWWLGGRMAYYRRYDGMMR